MSRATIDLQGSRGISSVWADGDGETKARLERNLQGLAGG